MKKIFFFLFCLMLGVPQVQAASYREWLLAAQRGDVVAMREVGYMQFTGNSPKGRDKKNGFAWLKKAADRGDDQAMYYLGRIYETGGYGAVNMKKAMAYYAAAAERGNEKAIRKLDDLKPPTPEAGHGGPTEVAQ